jgi:hypothetical protein
VVWWKISQFGYRRQAMKSVGKHFKWRVGTHQQGKHFSVYYQYDYPHGTVENRDMGASTRSLKLRQCGAPIVFSRTLTV